MARLTDKEKQAYEKRKARVIDKMPRRYYSKLEEYCKLYNKEVPAKGQIYPFMQGPSLNHPTYNVELLELLEAFVLYLKGK